MKKCLSGCFAIALLLAEPAGTPAALGCDGEPPKLVNKDTKAHSFQIQCAGKREEGEIKASAELKLDGKSGCMLKLGENAAQKLHTEMVCTIEGGELECDLI